MMRRCSVETSGTKPTISTEVPFAYGLKDGRGILRQEDNAHSLKITKGGALVLWKNDFMTLGRNYDKLTLELFAKCTDEKGGGRYSTVVDVLGSNAAGAAYTNALLALQVSNTNVTFRTHLKDDADKQYSMSICSAEDSRVPGVLADGRWHHVAVVVEETAASKIKVSGYYDYRLISSGTANIGLRDMLTTTTIKMGYGFTGYLDEVRMTADALTPSQFLRFNRGMALFFW